MRNAKHTHYLISYGEASEIDVPAVVLALMSRGRVVLAGETGRPERDQLAALLAPANTDDRDEGNVSVLLWSVLPIVVDSRAWGYVIWAV